MSDSSLIATVNLKLPWYKTIFHPTVLTAARIVLAPIILVALAFGESFDALIFWAIAELTDYFDGFFARRWKLASKTGELLDTLADKILHVPLFFFFLVFPKPKLPHFFLIQDIVNWIGYNTLLTMIAVIEAILLATRSARMQGVIDAISKLFHFNRYGELRVEKSRGAKIFGKIKTWIHAFSTGFFILATVMLEGALGHFHTDLTAAAVTAAQILVIPSIVFAFLSLQSRFTLKVFKRKTVK